MDKKKSRRVCCDEGTKSPGSWQLPCTVAQVVYCTTIGMAVHMIVYCTMGLRGTHTIRQPQCEVWVGWSEDKCGTIIITNTIRLIWAAQGVVPAISQSTRKF